MKKLAVAFVALAMIVVMGSVFTWSYIDRMSALKHETGRWAVIKDVNEDVHRRGVARDHKIHQ